VDVVRVAQQVADEVLFPAALSTDACVEYREALDAFRAAAGAAASVDVRDVLDRLLVTYAAEYARAWFTRLSHGFTDRLAPDDAATLTELLAADGPRSLSHRADLHIRGIRTVTLARRPERV